MSIKAMNWCRELKGLTGTNKSVLMYLCDRYNEKAGYAWPSISRIALDTGWAERTVTRSLRWLESKNYISSHRQFYACNGGPASNRYYLPIFGNIPIPGQVFLVGGSFNHQGNWEPDPISSQGELREWYGLSDITS